MPADTPQPYAAFRLNFEQQQKRAKELLKAANAGDTTALLRLENTGFTAAPFKLAHAQHCIAKELRFKNWAAFKQHITQMDAARSDLGAVLDGDCRTLHIRCGHDIQHTLREAGFHGDFHTHLNPYLEGPVVDAPDWLERRARFIADGFGFYSGMDYASALASLQQEEQQLRDAHRDYKRVMLWFEHDRYDQFVQLRCLAAFAEHGAPRVLEQLDVKDFPGSTRFFGLGQIPPEALQLLWSQRKAVTPEQLRFARATWQKFPADDPRPLAQLARDGTPLLPDLAFALQRHLQELPPVRNGLGLTQQLLLQALADHGLRHGWKLSDSLLFRMDTTAMMAYSVYTKKIWISASILRRTPETSLREDSLLPWLPSSNGKVRLFLKTHVRTTESADFRRSVTWLQGCTCWYSHRAETKSMSLVCARRIHGRSGAMKRKPNPERTDRVNPEWKKSDFAKAKPAAKVLPKLFGKTKAADMLKPRGRPKSDNARVAISIRLPPETLARWKATGPGWQTRMAETLDKAL